MKSWVSIAAVALVALSVSAHPSDVERFRDFQTEGVIDPTVSNADANAIIGEGIESDEPLIVTATIAALGLYSGYKNHSRQSRLGPLPWRTFPAVAGLKTFLIDHWYEQYERSGYNAFGEDVMMEVAPTTESMTINPSARFVWRMIPNILCTLYPGDAEVHDLLWDIHAKEADPGHWRTTHGLLSIGRFATPEANAYRMKELANPRGGPEDAFVAVRLAAKGLALSRPPEALPALVAAALQYPLARDDVLIVLAAYGDAHLATHSREIAPLLNNDVGTRPAVQRAIERLAAVTVD